MKKLLFFFAVIFGFTAFSQVNINNTSGPNVCDGSAYLTDSTATVISWNGSNGTIQNGGTYLGNLCAGTYSVVVSNGQGATVSYTFTIAAGTNPCNGFYATATTTPSDSNSCTGTMTVEVFGGVPPYVYQGNNLNNGPYISGLCAGTYSVLVTDASGCVTNLAGIVSTNGTSPGDTIILNGTIGNDSTVIGNVDGNWISNCTFDYNTVDSANVISLQSGSNSTYVTWVIYTSTGDSVFVTDNYDFPNGNGTYTITLQVYCSQKTGPKYLIAYDKIEYSLASISKNNIDFNVYPNPISEKLNIDGTAGEAYIITDITGKIVSSGKISVHTTIDASSWSIGLYVVKIGSKSIQFIKR